MSSEPNRVLHDVGSAASSSPELTVIYENLESTIFANQVTK